MKKAIGNLIVFAFAVGCAATQKYEHGRYPNQVHGGGQGRGHNNDPDPRDNRRDPRDHRQDPRDARRQWQTRPAGRGGGEGRRCIRCFDMNRWQGAVALGNEIPLFNDQNDRNRLGGSGTQFVIPTQCGIRSVSLEVLDNEAQITGLEVHYAGDPTYNWDQININRDWDFRNGSNEGDQSIWFDVGSSRRDDRVCIDRVRVSGFTYKDNYRDFENAKVQVYGSRVLRGAGGAGGYGPGPGPGGFGPRPPRVVTQSAVLPPALACFANIPMVNNHDDLVSDSFPAHANKYLTRCDNQRIGGDQRRLAGYQAEGYTCTIQSYIAGRDTQACLGTLRSKVRGGTETRTHTRFYTEYCSDQVWSCSKTIP